MSPEIVKLIAAIVKIAIMVGFFVNIAAVLTWMERRQSAMMQDRIGPNRADINIGGHKFTLAGLLHPIADSVKLFFKEDFIPPGADKLLHSLAPMLALFPCFVVAAVVPFTDTLCLENLSGHVFTAAVPRFGTCSAIGGAHGLPAISGQIADLNVGVLYIFALAGMGIIGATIAGWSSDNKFSLFGGLRAASQLVSYEVAMGLSLVGAMMVTGSVRLDEMARWQDQNTWLIFAQPLGFILFFAAALAETKRAPFDLPEGESEIVAGYLVEYSGMKFGMFYMGEFIEVATSSAFLVAVYLGGYTIPLLHRDGLTLEIGGNVMLQLLLPHLLVIVLQTLAFFTKVVLMCWIQIFIRWTLPRFRYDQLMMLGWRMLLPAAIANIFLTGVVLLAIDRAGPDTADRIKALEDVVNIALMVAINGGLLLLVVGFFSKSNQKMRRLPDAPHDAAEPAV